MLINHGCRVPLLFRALQGGRVMLHGCHTERGPLLVVLVDIDHHGRAGLGGQSTEEDLSVLLGIYRQGPMSLSSVNPEPNELTRDLEINDLVLAHALG